ncbi:MAG: hypothetical protein AUK53_07340 [Betaproteobacteria bacterium CG2_30_59_46]|nr:MAG: hypothetical protein AUK53_07340 [Betaproteobacteria bacterium CG2_30_59_46]PIQ11260.1 MAG: hypothetical protein COW70_12240 [Hydrogenophilales bacterium CG18_big_fil_WC_8_21_14_2_50_58_12]PIY00480.1 MAG: hypothetical protein COZ23_08040 [Hydrogenophilales bacterium CG_4_10_14_3_um_filter_58_23]PJB06494.1 MAG: hypothetical protein CO125_06945 [Hydrogenophilales bacterium CG_4_9_14_3_um_filter_59_35]
MKKLTIHLHAELEIPDDWEIVEHQSGIQALKIGDRFIDFDIVPLATQEDDMDATWTDEDEELTNEILMAVTGLDATLEIDRSADTV